MNQMKTQILKENSFKKQEVSQVSSFCFPHNHLCFQKKLCANNIVEFDLPKIMLCREECAQ